MAGTAHLLAAAERRDLERVLHGLRGLRRGARDDLDGRGLGHDYGGVACMAAAAAQGAREGLGFAEP